MCAQGSCSSSCVRYLGNVGLTDVLFTVIFQVIGRWSDPMCRSSLTPQLDICGRAFEDAQVRSRTDDCFLKLGFDGSLNQVISPGLLSRLKSFALIQSTTGCAFD